MVAAGIKIMTARVIVRAAMGPQQQEEKPTSIKSPTLSEKSSAETVAEMVAESMVESARQSAQGVKEATERKALKKRDCIRFTGQGSAARRSAECEQPTPPTG